MELAIIPCTINTNNIPENLAQKKIRVCWCCRTVNCLIRQQLSYKHEIQKRYAPNCTGKQITFSELKEQVKNKEASPTESNTASANIKLLGTKIDDHKDNQELKDASNDLNRITKTSSVTARKAKQIMKVEHKIVSEFNPRKYVDNKFLQSQNAKKAQSDNIVQPPV